MLLRSIINHLQSFIAMGFQHRLYLTLAQSNCTKQSQNSNSDCVPQPDTPSMLTEALTEAQPWISTRSFVIVQTQVHYCPTNLSTKSKQ